jgi:hypothetical protein
LKRIGPFALFALFAPLAVAARVLSLTPAQRADVHRYARVELARRCAEEGDVLGWGKALMPDKFRLNFCELHDYLVATRRQPFTSTEAPRGHAKTTIGCFLLPLYQGLVEPDAYRHYLNVQSNADKALTINRAIKMEVEQNQLIRMLYGEQVGERWTDACFVLKNGVVYSAEGFGASIRGLNYRGLRPDWVSLDDFYDTEADTNNPNGTLKKNEWFWGTLYPILAQDRATAMHLRGTAVNREDLFEKLKSDASVASKTFKAIVDWDEKRVLWEGLKTFEQFEQMRMRMGTLIFSRELQNERRDDSSSIVKMSWLYPEDGSPSWEYDPAELKFNEQLFYAGGTVTLDPSIGKKVQNDKSGYARVLIGQPPDGLPRFYIEALVNERHSFQQRIDKVKELASHRPVDRPVTKVRVETISGFKDVGEKIAASVAMPCELVDKVPDKITNLERASSIFENRRIFLNKNIDPALKRELVYQLTTNSPKNDDMRDAVLLAAVDESASWSSWV